MTARCRRHLRGLHVRLRDRVRRRRRLHAIVRFLKYGPCRGFVDDRARQVLLREAAAGHWRILYLGMGGRRQEGMVNLDITAETGPDIVGDGYRLPFADGCFDAIFCESVIEHVSDPERFLARATASLRPGGLWYLEVPFLQPRHGGVDFQRWTIAGFQESLRRAGLEPVAAGLHMGPGFMIFWILGEWLALGFSLGFPPLRALLKWLLGFLLAPILLLDFPLMRMPGSQDLACAHYHVARRPAAFRVPPA